MEYAYHSSPTKNRESIQRRGLLTMLPSNNWGSGLCDQPTGVYMMPNLDVAIEWPQSRLVRWSDPHPYMVDDTFDVWQIDLSGVEHTIRDPALDFGPWMADVCTHDIDPKFIKLVEQDIEWDVGPPLDD